MQAHHDETGKRFGMWIFLFTEILLFGGLFVLYSVYLVKYQSDFIESGKELDTFIGGLNTVILLISSFFVAASITAVRKGAYNLALWLLGLSVLIAAIFIVNKYFEWGHKIHLGIYPNSPALKDASFGKNLFFGLYYTITGLHGLHVIIGAILLSISAIFLKVGKITKDKYTLLENCGLYWHLVDLIWIFVFPLFYLII